MKLYKKLVLLFLLFFLISPVQANELDDAIQKLQEAAHAVYQATLPETIENFGDGLAPEALNTEQVPGMEFFDRLGLREAFKKKYPFPKKIEINLSSIQPKNEVSIPLVNSKNVRLFPFGEITEFQLPGFGSIIIDGERTLISRDGYISVSLTDPEMDNSDLGVEPFYLKINASYSGDNTHLQERQRMHKIQIDYGIFQGGLSEEIEVIVNFVDAGVVMVSTESPNKLKKRAQKLAQEKAWKYLEVKPDYDWYLHERDYYSEYDVGYLVDLFKRVNQVNEKILNVLKRIDEKIFQELAEASKENSSKSIEDDAIPEPLTQEMDEMIRMRVLRENLLELKQEIQKIQIEFREMTIGALPL